MADESDNKDLEKDIPDSEENQGQSEGGDEKKFTQDDLNNAISKRNRSLRTKHEALEGQLQKLLKEVTLSSGQRKELQSNLDSVQQEMMTKSELQRQEANKAKIEFEVSLKDVSTKKDYYKGLYEDQTIKSAIHKASKEHEGFNTEDFIAHLRSRAEVVKELREDGTETGRLVPRFKYTVDTDEGVKEVLKTASQAIEDMKKEDRFGNLFANNVAKGLGGSGNGTTGSAEKPIDKMSPEEITKNYLEKGVSFLK